MCPGNLPEDGLCSSPIRGQSVRDMPRECCRRLSPPWRAWIVAGLPVPLGAIILVRGLAGRLDSMLDVGKVQSRWSPFVRPHPRHGAMSFVSTQAISQPVIVRAEK